jgi:hypothetical protein
MHKVSMSYYIYCYQSRLGTPNIKEAQSIIEVFEEQGFLQSNYKRKLEIAQALINCNPAFTRSDFTFDTMSSHAEVIASDQSVPPISIQLNAVSAFGRVEVTIFDNNISLSVPYWYTDIHGEEVFEKLIVYTKIISRISGYYVYDPRAEIVYDPLKTCFSALPLYLKLAKNEGEIAN